MEFFKPCEKGLDKWFDEGLTFFQPFFRRKIRKTVVDIIDFGDFLKCEICYGLFSGFRPGCFYSFCEPLVLCQVFGQVKCDLFHRYPASFCSVIVM